MSLYILSAFSSIFLYRHNVSPSTLLWLTVIFTMNLMINCFCQAEKVRKVNILSTVSLHTSFFSWYATVCVFVITRIVESRNYVVWQTWTCQGVFWHWRMALSVRLGGWSFWFVLTEWMSFRSSQHLTDSSYLAGTTPHLLTLNQLHHLKGTFSEKDVLKTFQWQPWLANIYSTHIIPDKYPYRYRCCRV